MPSRKPDYRIKALRKNTDEKNIIGAGWANSDGSISLVLDPFISITSTPELVITMFPINRDEKS